VAAVLAADGVFGVGELAGTVLLVELALRPAGSPGRQGDPAGHHRASTLAEQYEAAKAVDSVSATGGLSPP